MELPSGTIILWTSGSSTIPDGWSIYSKANNRFIRGVPSGGTVEATGGQSTHTHTAGATVSGGAHTHAANTFTYPSANKSDGKRYNASPTVSMSSPTHTHTATLTLASAGSHNHALTTTDTGSANNLPPYKMAIYIIKN